MENQWERVVDDGKTASPTLRDLLAVLFRHRRLVILTFLGVTFGATLAAILKSPQYEAQMKILVKHERIDPVITSDPHAVPQSYSPGVTKQDLNTEAELIQSRDLLEKVVKTCGLQHGSPSLWDFLRPNSATEKNLRIAEAVRNLANDITVEPIKNSSMIEVSYKSTDPALASHVLTTLANDYLVKHLTVRRFPGAFNFFEKQANQYRDALTTSEKRLAAFSRETGGGAVSPHLQTDLVLQKATDFEAALWQSRALVAQTQDRIRALKTQLADTPRRIVTEDRKSDNPQLLADLKSSLASLELKRTRMLENYEPNYRPVKEVEAQIAQTRAAISAQKKAPVREETTDRNPTYQWLNEEMVKARTDLVTYRAQEEANERIVKAYHNKAVSLQERNVTYQDLERDTKVAATNYLLYLKKAEETHISNALDDKRIANVAIAEAPTVPPFPIHSPWRFLFLGVLLAVLVSLGSAFVADYFDSSFRTTDELTAGLNVPVLAAFPKNGA